MAKQRSFHEKLIQKLKRDAGIAWTRDYVDALHALNADVPAGEGDHGLIAAGLMGCLQHEAVIRKHDERARSREGKGLEDPFVYPGLTLAWESTPVAVGFEPGLIEAARADDDLDFTGTPTSSIRALMPACLLLDAREYGRELYDRSIDALAIYPSHDIVRGYDMLLIMGLNQRCGLQILYESKLLLVGDTLDDALSETVREREVLRGRGLAGIGRELHDWIFTPYDDEQEILFMAASLLGLMLWDGTRTDASERRGIPYWHVRSAEQKEETQELVSPYGSWDYWEGVATDALKAAEEDVAKGDTSEAILEAVEDRLESAASDSESRNGTISSPNDIHGNEAEPSHQEEDGPPQKADDTVAPETEAKGPEAGEPTCSPKVEQEEMTAEEEASPSAEPQDDEEREHEPAASNAEEAPAAPDWRQAYEDAQLENMRLADLLESQESRAATLEYHLRRARTTAEGSRQQSAGVLARAQVLEEMELPTTPAEALGLAERAFPDRLAILSEARKSATEFTRGSAAEVWAVLRSMAMELHPLVFGAGGGSITHAFQAKTGFELTLREMKLIKQTDKFSRLRTVAYKGEQRDATAHVKGRGVKRGETLRVHFFADYDERRIVIAHCGEHLPTYDTASI